MEVFVARQPIFDRRNTVVAYELLYRTSHNNRFLNMDGDVATSQVLANTFLLIGIEALTGGKQAFINFTENLLGSDIFNIIPSDIVAIEILESVKPTDEVIKACEKLKLLGFKIVLDDFVYDEKYLPLIALADLIKVDFLSTTTEERLNIVQRLNNYKVQFLAEKVETCEDWEQALSFGYDFFQGYFFSKPVIISRQDVPTYKLNYLRLLQEVNRDPDFDKIERIIKSDVSLTYKLLNYINSASYGFKTKIASIKQALVLLGIGEIKKWVSLVALKSISEDKPDEILRASVMRGRFGEMLAKQLGLPEASSELFLIGLFSMVDALLDKPLPEAISLLPVSNEVKNALLGERSKYNEIFNLVKFYEKGDWENFREVAELLKINSSEVPNIFFRSLEWTDQLLAG